MTLAYETIQSQIQELKNAEITDAEFVNRLAHLMAMASGANQHWILMLDDQDVEVISESDDEVAEFTSLAAQVPNFDQTLEWSVENQQVTELPYDAPVDLADPDLPREYDFFFVPVNCDIDADLVICLYRPDDFSADVDMITQQLALMATLGDFRAEAAKSKAIQQLADQQAGDARTRQNALQDALELGQSTSLTLEKDKSGFLLANGLKSYLAVDRVTLIEQTGTQMRSLAVSGQVTFNRRANVVRYTERLAEVVLKSGEALWFDGNQDELAEPIQKAVAKYIDESLVQSFALLPIVERQQPVFASEEQSLIELVNPGRTDIRKIRGAVLIESIQNPIDRPKLEARWEQVRPQVENNFNNAKQHSDMFMLPLILLMTKFFALFRGHTRRTAWGLTLGAAVLIAAGFLIRTDFKVRCEGYLQPEKMHHIFVGKDGVVTQVLAKEGQQVKAGQSLMILQNRELELEFANLTGELKEKQQQHEHMIYRRLSHSDETSEQTSSDLSYHEMAEQTGLLSKQIASLEKRLALKQKQIDSLSVRAPFAGQVMGWNVDRKFLNRPLEQGVRLFSVAKNNDKRLLELKVPDQRSGYIQNAYRQSDSKEENLQVEFSIASFPDQQFEAKVTHINPGLEQDTDLGYVLPVEAIPTSELPEGLRAGIPVVAKVECGRKSFIYCKTYEFVDWMHRTTFEYLF